MQWWKPAGYIVLSNLMLVLCLLDYSTTYEDFFSTMNALANSSLFIVVRINAIIANLLLLWVLLTPLFFGALSLEERSAVRQNLFIDGVELTAGILYGEGLVFDSPSIILVCCCAMGYLWSHICDARLQLLMVSESGLGRLTRVFRLAGFITIACEVLMVVLTNLWHSHEDTGNLLHESAFLYLTLLLLSFLEFAVRLATQEWARVLDGEGHTRSELVYTRRLFRFIGSLLFVVLFSRSIWKGSQAPLLLLRRVITHVSVLVQTPYELFKFYKMSLRLRQSPQVTQEELDAEDEIVCTICYETITSPSGTRRLACTHAFHETCLRQWFEEHSTCPYCRTDLLANHNNNNNNNNNNPVNVNEAPNGAAAAGDSEMEGEIQRAYLEYINSATLLQQLHSAASSTATPPPPSPGLPTSAVRRSSAGTHPSPEGLMTMGGRVGTLRPLPTSSVPYRGEETEEFQDAIAAIIQSEVAQEASEFHRAAAAIEAAAQRERRTSSPLLDATPSRPNSTTANATQSSPPSGAVKLEHDKTSVGSVQPLGVAATASRGAMERLRLCAEAHQRYNEVVQKAKDELERRLTEIDALYNSSTNASS